MKALSKFALVFICVSVTPVLFAQSLNQHGADDKVAVQDVISAYWSGLHEENSEKVLSCLTEDFVMFNGNYSGVPEDWQAHLYLRGANLEEWVSAFIKEAGPHENEIQFIHAHIRADAALVVTLETGKNRFRSWQEEKVTWFLGKDAGQWKLLGFFIQDIKNPE